MWKLLNWSRVLQIVLLILFLALQFLLVIGALMHFSLGRMIFRAVVMGIEAWILGYLFKTHVKRAFGAASP
jgi:VIT1/CCC1 family predicted Fe2+/Mn2+ transporter